MKKYLAIFVIALVAGAPYARAEMLGLLNDVTADGALDISGQQANNETDGDGSAHDRRGAVITRLRLGLNAGLADGVRARLEATRNSGATGAANGGTVMYGGALRPTSLTTEQGAIVVQNAYIDLEDFLTTEWFRLGRHYGGRPGDLLVYYGPYQDDSLTIQSLDGLSVGRKFGPVMANFVTGKVMEGAPTTVATDAAGAGDINVNWLILGSSELFPEVEIPLEFGYYQGTATNGPVASDNNNLTIMDFRAGYNQLMDGALKLGFEYAMNGGQLNTGPATQADYKGNALLLSAAYDDEANGFGLHARYANASGDDPSGTGTDDDAFHDFRTLGWAVSDFRYGEILSRDNTAATFLGFTSPGGLDTGANGPGANIINIGGYYVVPRWDEKVRLSLDYIMAKVNEVPSGVDDGVGSEIDLAAHYDHSSAVRATVGYAMFSPDKGLVNAFAGTADLPTDNVTKLFARLNVKFGSQPSAATSSARRAPASKAPANRAPARKAR
ncbi:MAG: hypothetical protein ACT4O3_00140 [Elusimicrobiota bacterium]